MHCFYSITETGSSVNAKQASSVSRILTSTPGISSRLPSISTDGLTIMSTCPDFIASVRAAQCIHLFSFLTSKSIFLLKVNSFTTPQIIFRIPEPNLTLGINGMTATPVKGCGRQNAHPPPSQLPLHNRLKNQYHSFPIVPLHR